MRINWTIVDETITMVWTRTTNAKQDITQTNFKLEPSRKTQKRKTKEKMEGWNRQGDERPRA